jgi:hypothetical protein
MSIADYRIYASPPSATKRMQKEFSNLAVSPFVLGPLEEIVTPRQNKEIDRKKSWKSFQIVPNRHRFRIIS